MSSARRSRRAFDWPRFCFEIILVALLCALLAFWATRLFTGESVNPPASAAAVVVAQTDEEKQRELLASAPLFGARAQGAVSNNIQPIGILAQPSGTGSAIISVDGQPPKAYQVGDDVGGRTLTALREHEVVLEYRGQRTTYRLPESRAALAPGLGISPVAAQ
ncbi:MAG: type II secretion system protein N [Burkholderiaceae bacterium]|jgi:general secretion pathway protein C